MGSFCNPPATIVTGATITEFNSNLAALAATYDGHWTQMSPLTSRNGVYQQAFRQQFPIVGTQRLAFESKRNYNCGMLAPQRNWWGGGCGC